MMSTKTHDKIILEAVEWARSLGYDVVKYNLGTKTGADAVFQNMFEEKVILEVVTGGRFRDLFKKSRIIKALQSHPLEILGLIVVGDRIDLVRKHGIEVGLRKEFFDSAHERRVFPVLVKHFEKVIPVLLVSLLGTRASGFARFAP